MSEAKKEKVQMDPKYILKLAGVLMLISAIVAGLLGLVNGVTWEKIAEIQAAEAAGFPAGGLPGCHVY